MLDFEQPDFGQWEEKAPKALGRGRRGARGGLVHDGPRGRGHQEPRGESTPQPLLVTAGRARARVRASRPGAQGHTGTDQYVLDGPDKRTAPVHPTDGVRQGCPLSRDSHKDWGPCGDQITAMSDTPAEAFAEI